MNLDKLDPQTFENALSRRVGRELQQKFAKSHVAICGLGGLGSHIALALARSGVQRLRLIDFDRVDISNLNRQNYGISELGEAKAKACAKKLLEINPFLELEIYNEKLDLENIEKLSSGLDVIVEAFDSPENKAMLINWVLKNRPDLPLVAGSGMAGLYDPNQIKTQQPLKNKKFWLCGDGQTSSETDPLFAPRVMLCAAHQATTVLQILASRTESSET